MVRKNGYKLFSKLSKNILKRKKPPKKISLGIAKKISAKEENITSSVKTSQIVNELEHPPECNCVGCNLDYVGGPPDCHCDTPDCDPIECPPGCDCDWCNPHVSESEDEDLIKIKRIEIIIIIERPRPSK